MPPEWMWHLDEELEEWFDNVEFLREQKYGGDSSDLPEDSAMVQNDLTRGRR